MLLSKKIQTIPRNKFWHSYAEKSVVYNTLAETEPLLSLRIFLDNVFGSLTIHEFNSTVTGLSIKCQKCEYVSLLNSDVCDTHLGFVTGMLHRVHGKLYYANRTTEDKTCIIKLKEYNG